MKILFVTMIAFNNNSSAMIRNKSLIRGLVENGNMIDMLTIPNSKISSSLEVKNEWPVNVNIINFENNKVYNSIVKIEDNLIGKIKKIILPAFRYIYHSYSLFDNTIHIAKKTNFKILPSSHYNLIISSSDPKSSHYAVSQLIKSGLKYDKWIQYWGDPLTIDIAKMSLHPKFYLKSKEKQLFSCADKIVYVSPFTLDEQRIIFPSYSDKMSFIPIPYSKKRIYDNIKKSDEVLKLGYFGDYTSKVRNIVPLYNVCKKEILNLTIAGYSDLFLDKTENVSILPRIPQYKVEELESYCDILICLLNNKGTQIPGKIYQYAATNKPIIIILDGERKEQFINYFNKFNRFVLCKNSEESILDAIKLIKNSNEKYIPLPDFDPKTIAKRFIDL